MEFLGHPDLPALKNLYPCLATITVTPPGHDNKSRRLSAGSGGEDENALKRVISGGRRKSSFGAGTGLGDERRKSGEYQPTGTWYWRVQAGVTDTHLVLLPLTQPPNALLTMPPAPLSSAMPTHSTEHNASDPAVIEANKEGSITSKMKTLFRRPSAAAPAHADASKAHASSRDPDTVDAVLDQSSRGEQLPSAEANKMGATNVNANAEMGWPGMVGGDKLGAVVISLQAVEKGKVSLGGGKKGEGSWVTVPAASRQVRSDFSKLVHPMLEPLGKNHHESWPKSGSIRFDFDKEWIGAKGEAELLHYHITNALSSLPSQSAPRVAPQTPSFQVGAGTHGHAGTATATTDHAVAGTNPAALGREVAPDE